MIENLNSIKEKGIQLFMENENEKWRCPDCGSLICCHNGICFNCGIDLLKNKRKIYRWDE
jgi:hypothetical protein